MRLKWFGHVEKMGEERLVKRVYRTNLKGNVRGGKERVTDEEKPE